MAQIFYAGFEANDFSEWTTTPVGSAFATSAAAALVGSYGCVISPTGTATTRPSDPFITVNPAATDLRLGFYLNINSLTGPTLPGNGSRIIWMDDANLQVSWDGHPSGLALLFHIPDDTGSLTYTTTNAISSGNHTIEIHVAKATTAVSSDGSYEVLIDGSQITSGTGIDNFNEFEHILNVASLELYGTAAVPGFAGTYYIDEIYLRDDDTPIFSTDYGPAAMTKPCDIDGDGTYLYVAALRSTFPILLKQIATLAANATIVFQAGGGTNIGVECGRQDAQVIWIAGDFGGTDTVERSTDAGSSFVVRDNGSFADITTFQVGPGLDDERVLAIDSDEAGYETVDGGDNWVDVDSGVGGDEALSLDRLPINPQECLVGSIQGGTLVEYSPNTLADTGDLSSGLPDYSVKAIIR